MLINDVMKRTGLTKKAIRFYEEKRLLDVSRNASGYRQYTDENLETLGRIKLLRMAGVSVSDIKLLFDDVITLGELLEKRRSEIEKEYGYHSSQFESCHRMISQYENRQFDSLSSLDEDETATGHDTGDLAVGIDIGTTSISATGFSVYVSSGISCKTASSISGTP